MNKHGGWRAMPVLAAALLGLGGAVSAWAQAQSAAAAADDSSRSGGSEAEAASRPAVVPNAEQIDLRSAQGRDYRIFIARPTGEAPAAGFPVIYLLDGNSVFGTAVEASRLQARALGPAVIVAIGYPVDTPFDGTRRYYDLTPKTDLSTIPRRFEREIATGGQAEFLDFIVDRVRPLVERRYRVDPKRQTLFGHSLGGHFVLYTMFTRPGLFQRYVAASPSIWWNDRSLLKERDRFAAMPAEVRSDISLKLIVGADELGHIVLDARNLITSLPSMRAYYQEVDDASHVSVLPAAINSGLHFALLEPMP